jgi:hypothetical protein
MTSKKLQRLGLTVRESDGRIEGDLELDRVSIVNPVTKTVIERITFTAVGDRLIVLDPPEMLGIEPVRVSAFERPQELEEAVFNLFNESVLHLERRSADLQALGLSPSVDPETLRLTAQVPAGELLFTVASDRRGNFRIVHASRSGTPLELPEAQAFELSEFREHSALTGYLAALVGESGAAGLESTVVRSNPLQKRVEPVVLLSEVVRRFGGGAVVPPKSTLEFLVEIKVNGAAYRFAAARVMGRTFRGLLAGANGKLWADRFELDEFPGVAALVGRVLRGPAGSVEIVGNPKDG